MADFFFMTAYEQPFSPSEVKIPENCQGNFMTHIIILLFHTQKIGVRKQN